jgi:hypothetical protein
MKVADIKVIAEKLGVETKGLKKAELVRAIQKAECNTPCYDTGASATCGQHTCLWNDDCE